MKKYVYIIPFFFFCNSFVVYSQISPQIYKNFSSSIISRLSEITSKAELSPQTQLKLARYFNSQDSLANITKSSGGSVNDINRYYVYNSIALKKILSPLEFNDINQTGELSFTFSYILKYRKELNLDQTQIDVLLRGLEQDSNMVPKSDSDLSTAEKERVVATLTPFQYDLFSKIVNSYWKKRYEEKALPTATADWQKLKAFGLTKGLDSSVIFNQILNYESIQLTKDGHNTPRLPILVKLDIYKGNFKMSPFSFVVKYREKFKLTSDQIDDLVNETIKFESYRSSKKDLKSDLIYSTKGIDIKLVAIIGNEMFDRYLYLNNYNQALQFSSTIWKTVKLYKLSKEQDSVKICESLYAYKLNLLNGMEKMNITTDQSKVDAINSHLILSQPHILLKAEMYTNSLPKSQLTIALDHRVAFNLNEIQIDTLLNQIPQIVLLRSRYAFTNPGEKYQSQSFENNILKKVLNESQIDQFLTIQNKDGAIRKSVTDWAELKNANLIIGLDSASVTTANLAYEMNYLIAKNHVSLENTPANVLAVKSVQDGKPDILKKLDQFKKNAANKNKTKGQLAW